MRTRLRTRIPLRKPVLLPRRVGNLIARTHTRLPLEGRIFDLMAYA